MTVTRTQRGVLDFIEAYASRHGHCPTIREIAAGRGTRGVGIVHDQVHKLAEAGYLRLHPRRRFELVSPNTIPLTLPADLAFAVRYTAEQAGITAAALITDILLDSIPCPQKRNGSA